MSLIVKYYSAIKMHKYTTLQKKIIISAMTAIIILASVVIYSLFFLSDNLFRALVSGGGSDAGTVQFNLEGFKSLGL